MYVYFEIQFVATDLFFSIVDPTKTRVVLKSYTILSHITSNDDNEYKQVKREISLLAQLKGSKFIVSFDGAFFSNDNIYLQFPFYNTGNLMYYLKGVTHDDNISPNELIKLKNKRTEKEIKEIFYQILMVRNYCY